MEVRLALTARRAISLSLLGALVALAGCGQEEETGPLSTDERGYVRLVEEQAKTIQVVDPRLTSVVLPDKVQNPTETGLPNEQMNAVQRKLDQRRELVDLWDGRECPSGRLSDLCDLWYKALADQYAWDQRFIEFINRPYTKARFAAVVEAGRKETMQWRRCKAEIERLRRKAVHG